MDNVETQNILTKKERRQLRREAKQQEMLTQRRKRGAGRTVKWLIVIAILVIALGGLFSLAKNSASTDQGGEATTLAVAVTADEWILGNASATTTLVEYSDFQCPACRSYQPLIKELLAEAGDQVRFVYRHFPLPQHQQAELAARAAEAAGRQGKFWEMHDMLFDRQSVWAEKVGARDLFLSYAAALNLNLDKFEADLDSAPVKAAVEADLASGRQSQVNSTPSFFVNGVKIKNPGGLEEFLGYVRPAAAE